MAWNSLHRKSVISQTVFLWFIFTSLVGRCKAQKTDIDFTVIPITIVVAIFICLALC